MANLIRGAGGVLSGAGAGSAFGPAGAVVGGLVGGLGGLFGGGDDDAQAAFERNRQLYQELLANYHGPEEDPNYQRQLSGLNDAANGGLTAADRASMLEAYSGAQEMAHGREGAIAQNAMMRGGGVANSGQSAVLQQQAAQQGAQRYQAGGMQAAGQASNRALQARSAYLDQIQRNKQSLNNYRLNAAAGMSGANVNEANFHGAKGAADNEALANGLDTAGQAGMYFANRRQPQQQPASEGYHADPYHEDSYLSSGAGYGY
jgi:hypothetical protein